MTIGASERGERSTAWIIGWSAWLGVWSLLAVLLIYVITVALLPTDQLRAFHSESGPVEAVTALLFLAMAPVALAIVWRGRRRGGPDDGGLPKLVLLWFALAAIAGAFVGLEEISYGQHLMGWSSPEFFEEHNKQRETNLHNLWGDAGSSSLRKVGNITLPIFGILLPLIFMNRREAYRPGHWTWFILPRWELFGWIAVSMLLSPIRKLGGFTGDGPWEGSLSEFKELLWAGSGLVYLLVMWVRLFRRTGGATANDPEMNRTEAAGA